MKNKDTKCNMEEYICLNVAGERFYTSDLEGLTNILMNYYKNTDEYKYYKDIEIYEPIDVITTPSMPNTEVIEIIN